MNIPEGGENLIILMAQQLTLQLTGAEKWGDNGEHFLEHF